MIQIKNGILSIIQVKNAKFIGTIKFDDGKNAPSLSKYIFADNKFDGKACIVQLENGQVIKIEVDGNEVIRSHQDSPVANRLQNKSNSEVILMQDSYKIEKTKLPCDTRDALQYIEPDNFALKLNKAARFDTNNSDNKFHFFKNRKGKPQQQIPEEKYFIKPGFNFDFSILLNQQKNQVNVLFGPNNFAIINYEIDWRLVVGLGNESVYETSMTLHHIYGFPYIPASALKGVVRSWIITEVFSSDEEFAIKDVTFCDIFGCPKNIKDQESYYKEDRQGKIFFFDAIPVSSPNIAIDIMNPHYADYYGEKSDKGKPIPPADYLTPVPIPFLVVEETEFQFIIGIKPDDNRSTISEKKITSLINVSESILTCNSTLLEITTYWLQTALKEHGIGAKTAVGYGFMKEVN